MEYLNIGSSPSSESCAQVGTEDYANKAKAECRLFLAQIQKHYPEPENGYLAIKAFHHDFGSYYEVIAKFDPDCPTASDWAYDIEGDSLGVLETWDSEFHPINLALERV
jgi:hypothetical protein